MHVCLQLNIAFFPSVFVAVAALCRKEVFWWHRVFAPQFPEVGAKSCCMFHGSEVS